MSLYNNIDQQLKEEERWVLWVLGKDSSGKLTKIPKRINDNKASTKDPDTWTTFDRVVKAEVQDHFDGIGFVLGAGYIGLDFDHCIDKETKEFIDPIFKEIIDNIGGYKEWSPSGDGIHVIFKNDHLEDSEVLKNLKKKLKKGTSKTGFKLYPYGEESSVQIEFYWIRRYFTMTGNILPESCGVTEKSSINEICDCVTKIATHFDLFPKDPPKKRSGTTVPISLSDKELIEKASKSNKGQQFTDFLNGIWEPYIKNDPSQSSMDLAFLGLLAWWSGHNKTQMERIFKNSGMYREEKGDSYLQITMDRAIEGCSGCYDKETYKEEKRAETELIAEQMEADPDTIFINQVDPLLGVMSKQPRILYSEIITKMAEENNEDMRIFMKGRGWSYLEDNVLIEINKGLFSVLFTRIADWMVYNNDKVPQSLSKIPDHVLNSVPELPERLDLFPKITQLINFPILKEDGSLITASGYDEETQLYILEDQDIKIGKTPEDLEKAITTLQEPFKHFQFATEEDRASAWAFFWTLLFRYRINGNVPYFAFKAPQWGVGKSLLLKSFYQVLEGDDPVAMQWPHDNFNKDEAIKRDVSGTIMGGSSFGYFDNVRDGTEIRSEFLALYATAKTFANRALYETIPRVLETNMIIAFTGNNITFGADLMRRSLTVELTTDTDTPEDRDLPDIETEIKKNRNDLLSAAMTILYHWQKDGKESSMKKGSFEDWSKKIGGILEFMGIDGFNTMTEKVDGEDEAFRQFISMIWEFKQTEPWAAKEVIHIAFGAGNEDDDQSEIRELSTDGLLEEYFTTDEKKRKAALGRAIKKRSNKVFKTDDDVEVRLEPLKKANPKKYALKIINVPEGHPRDVNTKLDDVPF